MSKIIDFGVKKDKKDGKFTVRNVIDDLLENEKDIDNIIVITQDKEGNFNCINNTQLTTKVLGTLEIAKRIYVDNLFDEY